MTPNVLVVDDKEMMRDSVGSTLTRAGFEVTTAPDARAALKELSARRPSAIVTDLNMPGMSGVELVSEVAKIDDQIPVILMTAYGTVETAVQAMKNGAYDYITKPFKMEEMKIVVKNAGEQIRLLNENRRLIAELQEAYEQIRIVKKIMGAMPAEDEKNGDVSADARSTKPLIAGSLLPSSYLENGSAGELALMSDLERIASLRQQGFLSEDEFELCKQRLLQNLKK